MRTDPQTRLSRGAGDATSAGSPRRAPCPGAPAWPSAHSQPSSDSTLQRALPHLPCGLTGEEPEPLAEPRCFHGALALRGGRPRRDGAARDVGRRSRCSGRICRSSCSPPRRAGLFTTLITNGLVPRHTLGGTARPASTRSSSASDDVGPAHDELRGLRASYERLEAFVASLRFGSAATRPLPRQTRSCRSSTARRWHGSLRWPPGGGQGLYFCPMETGEGDVRRASTRHWRRWPCRPASCARVARLAAELKPRRPRRSSRHALPRVARARPRR